MSEASKPEKAKIEKRLEKTVEIAATPEEVWKALTDPKELIKWFPLEARITPGVGGKLFLSWGPGMEGEAEIVAWDPGKRFAVKEPHAVIEFTLEARGAKTLVRLVQSGFFSGEDWEKEWFESTEFGWNLMLLGLRWAFERHPGVARQVAWPRLKVQSSREVAYARLIQPGALLENGASVLQPGAEYNLRTSTGETYSGCVEFLREPRGFCLSVRELNDALFWLTLEGPAPDLDVQIWLSAFGLPQQTLQSFESKWSARLKEIFS